MVRRLGSKFLIVMVLAVAILLPGIAQGAQFDLSKFHQEVGLRFAYGKNTQTASVHLYSLLPHWGIFIVPPGQCWGPFGLSFVAEGIISIAGADNTGAEIGVTPLLKFSWLALPSVLAFVEGGAGVIAECIDSPALAHTFNFTPQVGAGFDIALTSQTALTVAYRFRHSSNAGIAEPNPAFNVHFVQVGLNYYY